MTADVSVTMKPSEPKPAMKEKALIAGAIVIALAVAGFRAGYVCLLVGIIKINRIAKGTGGK
jgi:hypothetical protein